MDFDEALSCHLKWKGRLKEAIEGGSPEPLDPDIIARDDRCDLGRWIHGALEPALASKPEFQALRQRHAEFHGVAAEVVRKAKGGDPHGAALHLNGPFFLASSQVVKALLACKEACPQGSLTSASPHSPGTGPH